MRAAVFGPRNKVNVFAMIEELKAQDLIRHFRHGNRNFGVVGGFGRHQHVRRAFVSGVMPSDLYAYAGTGRLREGPQQTDFGFPTAPREVPALETPQQKRRHRTRKRA